MLWFPSPRPYFWNVNKSPPHIPAVSPSNNFSKIKYCFGKNNFFVHLTEIISLKFQQFNEIHPEHTRNYPGYCLFFGFRVNNIMFQSRTNFWIELQWLWRLFWNFWRKEFISEILAKYFTLMCYWYEYSIASDLVTLGLSAVGWSLKLVYKAYKTEK